MKRSNLIALSTFAMVLFVIGLELVMSAVRGEPEITITDETTAPETDIVFEPIPDAETETEIETEVEIIETETPVEEIPATINDDLMCLAKIVQNEAGSDFCTDEHQRAVASVVINRVSDPRFPDSIYEVITQGWNGECPLQYAVGGYEAFAAIVPSERAIANAEYVLTYGATVEGAIWQAEFIQGEIVAEFAYPEIYSTVTYICR